MNTASGAIPSVSNASFVVKAKLLTHDSASVPGPPAIPMQTWEITATGKVLKAQVQVREIVQRSYDPPVNELTYGAEALGNGCGAITISGNVTTDSFDSSKGTYTATHKNSGGNIAANGNLTASGNSTVHGAFSSTLPVGATPCGPVTATSGVSIDAGTTLLGASLAYATPAYTGNGATNKSVNGGAPILLPGKYGSLSISGNGIVHLTNGGTDPNGNPIPGLYNFSGISVSGNGMIVIDSGPVILNLDPKNATPISASGNFFANNTGKPSNLTVQYGGTGTIPLSGNAGTYGLVIAPLGTISMSGNVEWFGQLIAKKVTGSGNATIHYDVNGNSRTTPPQPSAMHITYFSWNKF
jgi:hypothetical protein